jgi:hypothetical protein
MFASVFVFEHAVTALATAAVLPSMSLPRSWKVTALDKVLTGAVGLSNRPSRSEAWVLVLEPAARKGKSLVREE